MTNALRKLDKLTTEKLKSEEQEKMKKIRDFKGNCDTIMYVKHL